MPQITLADIKEAADRKYGPLVIAMEDGQTVTLLNALRMPKAKRAQLMKLQASLGGADEGDPEAQAAAEEAIPQIIRLVAQSKADADRLIKAIGDDMAQMQEIFEAYAATTQPGEASASPS